MERASSALLCLGIASAAHALGLSEISQQSTLGEPLRLVIPVLGNAGEAGLDELSGCVRLTSPSGNDLPQLNSARVALEQAGGATSIVITTPYPVNEPAMRIAVQAGCRTPISREYTVLLDPVTIEPPTAQIAANPPQRQADERAAGRADIASAQSAKTLAEARSAQRPAMPQKRAAAAPRAQPTTGTRTAAQIATAAQPATAQGNDKSVQPRLHISRTIGDRGSVGKGTAPTATSQREAMAAIEEQTVVLKRQLAELELAMQQVREQLDAAKAARAVAEKAARDEAAATAAPSDEAAKAGRDPKQQAVQQAAMREATQRIAPPTLASKLRAWTVDNAAFMLTALLAVLAIAFAASIRRRQPVLIPAPMTSAQAESFNRADLGEPSVPGHPLVTDAEALVRLAHEQARGHMVPPLFVDPIAVEPRPVQQQHRNEPQPNPPAFRYDPALSFDWEVQKHAEERSVQSALEREQPGIIARLTDGWGTPRTAAQVESFLLTPRRSGKPLSRDAVDELQFLRRIAMDGGGPDGEMQAWMPRGRAHSPTAVRPH